MTNEEILKIENLNNMGNTFIIRWNMTSLCNYSCAFCIQGNKDRHISNSKGESAVTRDKICTNLIKFIEEKINGNYKSLKIYLIGGEITILKDFINIFERLINCSYDGQMTIQITTNLSAPDNVIRKIKDIILTCPKKRKLQISASYYKEFAKEKEFIKKAKILHTTKNFNLIINKCLFKKRKKNEIIVTIGYPIVDDNDYKSFIKFKRRYHNCANKIFSIVIRKYKTNISDTVKNKLKKFNVSKKILVTLTDNRKLHFKNNTTINLAMKDNKVFNPKGMLCDSGINNISINNLGDVSRCCSWSKDTKYANIITDDLELLKDKFLCPGTSCSCNYYSSITKIKK